MLKFRQLCCFPWVGIIVSGRILCRTSCGALCMKIAIKIWNAYDCERIRQGETTMDMALQSGPQFFLRSQRVHYYPPLAVWMHCSMCPALYANRQLSPSQKRSVQFGCVQPNLLISNYSRGHTRMVFLFFQDNVATCWDFSSCFPVDVVKDFENMRDLCQWLSEI